MARPPKYTPERCAAILDDIRHLVPYEIAAEANGIHEDTLYDWINKGRLHLKEDMDSELARFSEGIKRIEADRIRSHVRNIASKDDKWQADAWLLERRWWKHFSSNAAIVELNKRLDRLEMDTKEKGDE